MEGQYHPRTTSHLQYNVPLSRHLDSEPFFKAVFDQTSHHEVRFRGVSLECSVDAMFDPIFDPELGTDKDK